MLNKDPQKRPSAVELLRDPYISGHLQDLLSKMTDKNKSATAESDAREILHALYKLLFCHTNFQPYHYSMLLGVLIDD